MRYNLRSLLEIEQYFKVFASIELLAEYFLENLSFVQ